MLIAQDLCLYSRATKITSKIKPNKAIIDHISLTIEPGEFVVIIGPNGAGKSTLMKLLTGFIKPDKGLCELHGKPLQDWSKSQLAKLRAVMLQQQQITFPFTVKQVVAMGLTANGNKIEEKIVKQVLEFTDSLKFIDKDFRALSGGEQQRVELSRVLAQIWPWQTSLFESKLLFLDEPTSALDLHHQQSSLRLLKKLTEQSLLSVCCILHDLNLAALYADKIILLHDGKIVCEGSPHYVLNQQNLQHWYQVDLTVLMHESYQKTPQIHLLK